MTDLFSLAESRRKRDLGMSQAAAPSNASEWLHKCRQHAQILIIMNGEVSSDQVLQWCPRPSDVHPNATGSIFRDKRFKIVGYKTSSKVSARARRIAIYQLNEDHHGH